PRRWRQKGRHGAGSRTFKVLNPMKQIRVNASTPPARATDTTPSRTRSAAIASEAAPELHAVTTVSRGPPRPSTLPTTSTWADGKHDARASGSGVVAPRARRQYHASASSMPPATPPTISAESARLAPARPATPGIVEGRVRGRERESIGARPPSGTAQRVRHLGADAAAEAFGVDQGDRTDRARAAADALPEGLDAGAERADDPQTGDGDGLHAPSVLEAMKRDSVSNDVKWGARSCDSSIAIPKRSSIAIDSSMKSSESRPIELSMPLGKVVSRVKSTARRGSNLSRVTRIVLSSSNTSLGSITLPSASRVRRDGRAIHP